MKPIWRPVTSGAPHGLILGPALFNIFINDLYDGTEDMLDKFAGDDTKMGGMFDRADGCGAIQRDFRRLEVWVNRNLTMFKGKCYVLHMARNNLRHQYELRVDQLSGKKLCRKGP